MPVVKASFLLEIFMTRPEKIEDNSAEQMYSKRTKS
jgi:hypothetical protein